MKKRINLLVTNRQFEMIKRNADILEIKPGTWSRMVVLSAAGCQYIPGDFSAPTKIKQLNLFKQEKKRL